MKQAPRHAILYEPFEKDTIKGAVQIVHGMCEHQLRYTELAAYLNERGYAVVTSDLRGHGENISVENDLGYFGENAVAAVIGDIHEITTYIKGRYPDLPCFLLGHSMGSLISTTYFKRYAQSLDGLFLSGIPGYNQGAGFAKKLIKFIENFKGEYYRSKLVNALVNGPFAKPFLKEGSKFAWISKDTENVKKYEADPLCGFTFTLNGFYTLMEFMQAAYKDSFCRSNLSVPVRLMSGADDPCMGSEKNFMRTVQMFRDAGYKDVEYILYEGQRHEIFNDTEKETSMKYLADELDKITG